MLLSRQKNPKTKKLLYLFVILLSCLFVFLFTSSAFAQWGVEFFRGRPEFVAAPGGAAGIIVNVVMWMMSIIAFLALGFIVFGAIRYVTSAGNEKQVEEAKRIVLYAVIGLVIAILAVVIIQLVGRAVQEECETSADCPIERPFCVRPAAGEACRCVETIPEDWEVCE